MDWATGIHRRTVERLRIAGIGSRADLLAWLEQHPEGNHIIGRVMRAELVGWLRAPPPLTDAEIAAMPPSPEFSPGHVPIHVPENGA